MTNEEILNRIKPLFNDCCGIEHDIPEIKSLNDNLYGDLGLTSLSLAELCMLAEHEFNITIDDDDIPYLKTVNDLVQLIQKTLNNND